MLNVARVEVISIIDMELAPSDVVLSNVIKR
jgi:hypothetical protein